MYFCSRIFVRLKKSIFIGLAKKLFQVFLYHLRGNLNELFDRPNISTHTHIHCIPILYST